MKRVRITVDASELPTPSPSHRLATRDGVDTVQMVNWNISAHPVSFLYRIWGEHGALASDLQENPDVAAYEILPQSDRECYCFVTGVISQEARAMFENFTAGSLLTVPPLVVTREGRFTGTLVGEREDVQAAISTPPDRIDVTVEEVGGTQVASNGAAELLAPRQREAISVALALGYYDVPREAAIEDIAAELGCATGTAAEHLRKAESVVMSSLFDDAT